MIFGFRISEPVIAQSKTTTSEQSFSTGLQENRWYKNVVIYNLELDTFKDSDGNGIGDFQGLIQQLDYLDVLGVDVIWLAPFQPSPRQDNGYDISDYYGVNPIYGTSGDFSEFMHEAEKRGMRVIMDLVVNHTSDQHPWFQEARQSMNSKYRSWYVWSEERPKDWNKGMVFPGVQQETWTFDKKAGAYYSHRFYRFQPDLNFSNTEVQTEVQKVMGHWLRSGVAGFRLDAVPFIIEDPYSDRENPTHRFQLLKELLRFIGWRKGDAVVLGEANVEPGEEVEYFGKEGNGMSLMFNFYANQHLFYALATGQINEFTNALQATKSIPEASQWANFLRNHDELDLGRLTEEQRDEVYQAFGPKKNMQLYDRGIRRRLAPMLGNRKQLELAYSLLFSLPGTPVIRYGDEIGMGDDLSLKERNAVRTPMQWSNEPNAGFSEASKTDRPVIDEGQYSYHQVNVAAQRRNPNSLLNWTAKMIRLRKECPEVGLGDWTILDLNSPHVLAIKYDWKGSQLVMIHNFSKEPQQVQIKSDVASGKKLVNLIEEKENTVNKEGVYQFNLEEYGYQWYRVGGVMRN
ncbi:alpha-amylase family protein [Pontibacter silvestris]|uniref:alpha-amylase family protein n=1 Tax=Pontibacter silvestris TaxID=2305183 RepID=UPI00293E83CC|nr:alpha-amylase family protein [Pontibacter silvestris]